MTRIIFNSLQFDSIFAFNVQIVTRAKSEVQACLGIPPMFVNVLYSTDIKATEM